MTHPHAAAFGLGSIIGLAAVTLRALVYPYRVSRRA